MKYLFINTVPDFGSTGKIVFAAAKELDNSKNEVVVAYGRGTPSGGEKGNIKFYKIGSKISLYTHLIKARLFDRSGFGSYFSTLAFLKFASRYNPDVLWLHNLHGYYINIKLLFKWIKSRPGMQVKWTLHDCWSFTGHCTHFSAQGCDRWKKGCYRCPLKKRYPKSLFIDNSKRNYKDKKCIFTGVENMTLHPVSYWLEALVKKSFLKGYKTEVIYNSVDKNVFKFTKSDFRQKNNLENKKVILGVASSWNDRKGLYEFFELSKRLPDYCKIVLAGLNEKQMSDCPDNILALPLVKNQTGLAKIYSAADIYLNLSKEETFGLTTLEAVSCGTFAVVYKNTACEEIVRHFGGGEAVEQNLDSVLNFLIDYLNKRV